MYSRYLKKAFLSLAWGLVITVGNLQGADSASLTIAQRKALLAQQQAQDKSRPAKPVAAPRTRPAAVTATASQATSPETVAVEPAAAAPAPVVALAAAGTPSPEPGVVAPAVAGSVKARAAALAAQARASVPAPGRALAKCEGVGCRQAAYEALKQAAPAVLPADAGVERSSAALVPAAQAEAQLTTEVGPGKALLAAPEQLTPAKKLAGLSGEVAAQARAKHGGAAVPAMPDLTAEQLAGKTVGEREAERRAALAVEKAEVKRLAELAVAEAAQLEQERAARLAAEAALRQEQERLASAAAAPAFDYDQFVASGIALPPMTEADWAALAATKPAQPAADTGWWASLRQRAGGWLG